MKAVTDEDVMRALAAQLDLEYLEVIGVDDVDAELVKKMPINFAKQYQDDSAARPRATGW